MAHLFVHMKLEIFVSNVAALWVDTVLVVMIVMVKDMSVALTAVEREK